MSLFRLDNKIAVVTGAGSGIGRAIALLLAKQGATVSLIDINLAQVEEVESEIEAHQGQAQTYKCDVSNFVQVQEVFAAHSQLDILINNAGISHVGNVEKTTTKDFDKLYNVNVKGVFHCLKFGIDIMLKSGGGAIVNLASIASEIGMIDRFAYSMSKGAVRAMTLSVAADYVKQNIRCNCICPARVHTPFVDGYLKQHYPGNEPEMFNKLSAYQPLGRMGTPEEIAYLVLYLCSDEAKFTTGSAYPIDGGVINLR